MPEPRTTAKHLIDSPGADRYVLAGGAGDFLLAFAVGPLATVPLSLAAAAVGLAVTAAAGVASSPYRWIEGASLLSFVPAIGAAAMLSEPVGSRRHWLCRGVRLPVAALVRFAGRTHRRARTAAVRRGGRRRDGRRPAGGLLRHGLSPSAQVLRGHDQAETETNPARVEARLYEAGEADPFSADPWRKLSALAWQRWQVQPSPEAFARFKAANDNALRLTRHQRRPASSGRHVPRGLPANPESRRSARRGGTLSAGRRAIPQPRHRKGLAGQGLGGSRRARARRRRSKGSIAVGLVYTPCRHEALRRTARTSGAYTVSRPLMPVSVTNNLPPDAALLSSSAQAVYNGNNGRTRRGSRSMRTKSSSSSQGYLTCEPNTSSPLSWRY